ncbi:MAG TPA: hypothetical protein VMR18_02905 [Candidatus Saccharimonadales bacterium]|nr:hypothetical protein [Candidatus Saccharimonadales bacterium]
MGNVPTPMIERGLALFPPSTEMVPAPTDDETGLALLPTSTECLGDKCTLANTPLGCYDDLHHLYFWRRTYEKDGPGSLYWRLRHNPFNVIEIARCQHDRIHDQYTPVEFPEPEIVREFFQQSGGLKHFANFTLETARYSLDFNELRWGTISRNRGLEPRRNPAQLMRLGHLAKIRDRHLDRVEQLASHLQDADLLQHAVIINPFVHIGKTEPPPVRRRALHIVRSVVKVPELDKAA